MADAIDEELLVLINKLNRIQKDIGGGKKKESLGDKNGKIDRFVDLYDRMNERLEIIKNSIDEIRKLEKIPGSNPKELIGNQSKVRTELHNISEEWKDLDTMYRLESKKKRSRYTPEQLAARQEMVVNMQTSIQEIKDMQRQGYVKGYEGGVRVVAMKDSEMFKKRDIETGHTLDSNGNVVGTKSFEAKGVVGKRNNHMTDDHIQGLIMIKQRDAQIDDEIEEIGKGVDILREIALAANEEVKVQNKMLDVLEEKVNDVHDHVTNLNGKMLETIEKVRSSDKLCMDIICVIMLVGMIIVFVKINSDAS